MRELVRLRGAGWAAHAWYVRSQILSSGVSVVALLLSLHSAPQLRSGNVRERRWECTDL